MEGFHAAYLRGQVTRPPNEYIDLVLVPHILHTPTLQFWEMPEAMQEKTRRLLLKLIAGGWAGNTAIVKRDEHAEL